MHDFGQKTSHLVVQDWIRGWLKKLYRRGLGVSLSDKPQKKGNSPIPAYQGQPYRWSPFQMIWK